LTEGIDLSHDGEYEITGNVIHNNIITLETLTAMGIFPKCNVYPYVPTEVGPYDTISIGYPSGHPKNPKKKWWEFWK